MPQANKKSNQQGFNQQKLNVKIGDIMQVQLMGNQARDRFTVSVIGLSEGRSLIITAPHTNGNVLMLHEGQQFVIRSLSGTQILGFAAEVLKTYMSPYPHVHLRIPSTLEYMNVRNAYRIDVDLIASVRSVIDDEEGDGHHDSDDHVSAVMVNISSTGCMLKSDVPLNEQHKNLRITVRLNVADESKLLTLPAELCSHREQQGEDNEMHHIYGIKFEELEYDKRLLLYCYVYEQIAHEVYQE